jgi:hypothetical protein
MTPSGERAGGRRTGGRGNDRKTRAEIAARPSAREMNFSPRIEMATTQVSVTGEAKQCSHCGQWRPLSDFPSDRKLSSGFSSWCRPCHRAATAAWRVRTNYAERDRQPKR